MDPLTVYSLSFFFKITDYLFCWETCACDGEFVSPWMIYFFSPTHTRSRLLLDNAFFLLVRPSGPTTNTTNTSPSDKDRDQGCSGGELVSKRLQPIRVNCIKAVWRKRRREKGRTEGYQWGVTLASLFLCASRRTGRNVEYVLAIPAKKKNKEGQRLKSMGNITTHLGWAMQWTLCTMMFFVWTFFDTKYLFVFCHSKERKRRWMVYRRHGLQEQKAQTTDVVPRKKNQETTHPLIHSDPTSSDFNPATPFITDHIYFRFAFPLLQMKTRLSTKAHTIQHVSFFAILLFFANFI